jgi:hypothetical protein
VLAPLVAALHRAVRGRLCLSRFSSLFEQLDAARSEVGAHKIDMNLQGKEQLRMPHRNAKDIARSIHALNFGFKDRDLRGR